MSDTLSESWKASVSIFWQHVHDLNEKPHENMSRFHKTELKAVEDGLHTFIVSFNADFNASCTHQNLVFLSNSWATFKRISPNTSEYWYTHFPQWSYMITQLHAFVNERAIADIAAHIQSHPAIANIVSHYIPPPIPIHAALLHSLLLDLKDTYKKT